MRDLATVDAQWLIQQPFTSPSWVIEDLLIARLWIGNTYLDDSGRDSPASLNSTGDM